jgi:hypothetical protein
MKHLLNSLVNWYDVPLPCVPFPHCERGLAATDLFHRRKVVRRGVFTSRADPVAKIMEFIRHYNEGAAPFQWTYTGKPLAA